MACSLPGHLRLWERKQEDLLVEADDGQGVVQVGNNSELGEHGRGTVSRGGRGLEFAGDDDDERLSSRC